MDFRWAVGIELGDNHLALVCLKQAFFQVKLVDYLLVDSLPQGPESERQRIVSMALTEFFRGKRHRLDNVTLCLPRKRAVMSYLDLPEVAKENLDQVIEFEFERFFPFKKESCYFSHRRCPSHGSSGQIRIQVVAVQREFLQRVLAIFQGMKLPLMAVEPSSFALGSYIRFGSANGTPDYLVLTVRPGEVSLDVWRGTDLAFSRSLASNSLNGALTYQIQKELLAARERFGVEQTFYCGVLAQRDLSVIPSLTALGIRGLLTNRVPPESQPYVLPACGAALRGLGRGSTDINLLPEALRTETARLVTTTTYILLAVLMITTLGFGGSLLFRQYQYGQTLERKLRSIAPKIEEVEKLQREGDGLEKVIKLLHGAEGESPKKIAVLRELTRIIPKEAYITELRVDDERIELVGLAKSATELISTLESSPFFRGAQFSSPITKRGPDLEMFSLKAEIASKSLIPPTKAGTAKSGRKFGGEK